MKHDVYSVCNSGVTKKPLCKETLNHRELIRLASGLDPLTDTSEAFLRAYRSLGIDIINRVPLERCPVPLDRGQSMRIDDAYSRASLGVYDTWYRHSYPYDTVDNFLSASGVGYLDYHALRTPVPHPLTASDIARRQQTLGNVGMYYCQLYTTLFMWGIEYLGWEVFMMAIALDPQVLDKQFLEPAFAGTKELVDVLLAAESPYVFLHDDIAVADGLACNRDWMQRYLFPRYHQLFDIIHAHGKKVVFVCDGNCSAVLQDLVDLGVDAVMLESPATPIEYIADVCRKTLIIGGIDTRLLTNGSPDEVSDHVHTVMAVIRGRTFAISSCGGLHDGIPMENLEAYFDTRAEYGFNGRNWRFPQET